MYSLEINQVSKKYGSFTALENIDFKIEKGAFVGLLGLNGAGKTSLISAIAGVNKFEGNIKVLGYDVQKQVVQAKQNLGVVPQELTFDPFLNIYQTLKFQSGLYGIKNNDKWIYEVIERLHLTDKMYSNTRSLSGGMKRRLMVAQALMHKPQLIILDEPTAGVDVEIRRSLWKFITELHRLGHTILLTTHYIEEIEELCDKIIIIEKGKITSQGSKVELMNKFRDLPSSLIIETKDGTFPESLKNLINNRINNKYNLKFDNYNSLTSILSSLQTQNIEILHIDIHHPRLEDIFVHNLYR